MGSHPPTTKPDTPNVLRQLRMACGQWCRDHDVDDRFNGLIVHTALGRSGSELAIRIGLTSRELAEFIPAFEAQAGCSLDVAASAVRRIALTTSASDKQADDG